VPATPKAEIPHLQHANAYAILRYHVFQTLPSCLPIFLRKACLDTQIGRLNPEFDNLVVKFGHFVAYAVTHRSIESHLYIYMFSIFCRIRILRVESVLSRDSIYAVCDIVLAYVTLQHLFWTPLSPCDLFFLGKPAWTLESDG